MFNVSEAFDFLPCLETVAHSAFFKLLYSVVTTLLKCYFYLHNSYFCVLHMSSFNYNMRE